VSVQAMSFVIDYNATTAAEARGEAPLSVHERAVLLSIANYADKGGWNSYPAARTISDETGVGLTTVRDAEQHLWSLGLVDVERRPGRERGTTGHFLRFRVVMDRDTVVRKATARRLLSPFDDDGLDDEGWARPDGTPPSAPPPLLDDVDRANTPPDGSGPGDATEADGPEKGPAGGAFEPAKGTGPDPEGTAKAPREHRKGTARTPPHGAFDPPDSPSDLRFLSDAPAPNHEPGTIEPSSSSSSDSRAPFTAEDDDDRERVLAACRLLAGDDLADRNDHNPDLPSVASVDAWLDTATARRLEQLGEHLTRYAANDPDASPDDLLAAAGMAGLIPRPPAPSGAPSSALDGARVLDDGSLVLPGTGLVTRPDWPEAIDDAERARGLEIARQIPRPDRPTTDDTEG